MECVIPYHLDGLEGADGRLEAVHVKTLKGETRRLEADVLLPFYGLAMNLGPIAEWGLGLDRNHVSIDPSTSMTDRDGHLRHRRYRHLQGQTEADPDRVRRGGGGGP